MDELVNSVRNNINNSRKEYPSCLFMKYYSDISYLLRLINHLLEISIF